MTCEPNLTKSATPAFTFYLFGNSLRSLYRPHLFSEYFYVSICLSDNFITPLYLQHLKSRQTGCRLPLTARLQPVKSKCFQPITIECSHASFNCHGLLKFTPLTLIQDEQEWNFYRFIFYIMLYQLSVLSINYIPWIPYLFNIIFCLNIFFLTFTFSMSYFTVLKNYIQKQMERFLLLDILPTERYLIYLIISSQQVGIF